MTLNKSELAIEAMFETAKNSDELKIIIKEKDEDKADEALKNLMQKLYPIAERDFKQSEDSNTSHYIDIDDLFWTAKYSNDLKNIIKNNESDKHLKNLIQKLYIVAKIGFGDCFDINYFINAVKHGSFIDYDGVGDWVDKWGNDLGRIWCDVSYLKKQRPKDAAYIMWYNK